MRVIIREDDPNLFTDQAVLENIYAPCHDADIPISYAVTPLQSPDAGKRRLDIPLDTPKDKTYPILQNKALSTYLKRRSGEGDEICLHGISHRPEEENLFSLPKAEERFGKALKTVQDISSRLIATYVPPFGRLDRRSLQMLVKRFNIAYSHDHHYRHLPIPFRHYLFPSVVRKGKSRLFLSEEYLFGRTLGVSRDPQACLRKAQRSYKIHRKLGRTFILINHWWDLHQSGDMIAAWHRFVNWLKEDHDGPFTTFRDFASS